MTPRGRGFPPPSHRAPDQRTPKMLHRALTQHSLIIHKSSAPSLCFFSVPLTDCWSHCRNEEDLPPSFTESFWGTEGGKKGGRRYSPTFSWQATLIKLAPGRWTQLLAWVLSVACLHVLALSCTSGTTRWRLKFKRGFHSNGQVPGWRVVWTGETEGAALDFGQNNRIVLRGQHRGTAVGTLFSLTAHVGFIFLLLLFHFNAHCQHLDEVGWWRGIWLSCWRCTGGRQDKKNKTNRTEK